MGTDGGNRLKSFARSAVVVVCAGALLWASGCADYLRRKQLESVAKNWCETIRASQVIPVYPLTEDLRPGDVFLVRYSIAAQQEEWKEKGFLALDDFRVRLGYVEPKWWRCGLPAAMPEWFKRMYFSGYWVDEFGAAPHPRPKIDNPGEFKPSNGDKKDDTKEDTKDAKKEPTGSEGAMAKLSQAQAPRAAFPSYSFQVRSGSGLGLAIPIQGVPVGLSFMQTGSADGTVTIADAYTYAADPELIYRQLMEWAEGTADRKAALDSAARQSPDQRVFLRVVTRVYLTGSMAVSLHNSESGGFSGRAGADVGAKLFNEDGTFNENYKSLLKALDDQANQKLPFDETAKKYLPGGSVKFAWASSRGVAMNQTFDTPLVVGYLGFDVPVFPGTTVGEPEFGYSLPTWSILANRIDRFDDRRQKEGRMIQQVLLLAGMAGATVSSADPARAEAIMREVSNDLGKEHAGFKRLANTLAEAEKIQNQSERAAKIKDLVTSFQKEANDYVSNSAGGVDRTKRFSDVFDRAFEKTRVAAPR